MPIVNNLNEGGGVKGADDREWIIYYARLLLGNDRGTGLTEIFPYSDSRLG